MKKIFILLCVVSLLAGCAGIRPDVKAVRNGILKKGIHMSTFEDEWGLPEKTEICNGAEFTVINHYTGDVAKMSSNLECWLYTQYGVTLVSFENNLVGWKTDKNAAQLRKISEARRGIDQESTSSQANQ